MIATEPTRSAAAKVPRDQVTIGLMLIRALVAGDVGYDVAWPAIADFYSTVVQPLLEGDTPDASVKELIAWCCAAADINEIDDITDVLDAETVPEDVLFGLWELADLVKAGAATSLVTPPTTGPDILVEQPNGQYVLLEVQDGGRGWSEQLPESVDRAVKAALRATLSPFPSVFPADWVGDAEGPPSVCWAPGIPFAAPAVALPIALWHIGQIAGLGKPEVLCAGDLSSDLCHPVVGRALHAKVRAAKALGRPFLAPTESGWRLFLSNETETSLDGSLSLDSAAAAVWGQEWLRWKRDRHAEELSAAGWRVIDWRVVPGHPALRDIDTSQTFALKQHFSDGRLGPKTAILGGTPRSGKSTIVRRLATSLSSSKRNARVVQVIEHSENHELPDKFEAATVATHAVGLLEGRIEHPLLVFENLQPISAGDVGEVLRHVSRELGISVLAVVQDSEDSPTDWNSQGVFVATSVVGTVARRRFVEDLTRADGSLDPDAGRTLLADDRGSDLRRITQVMAGQQPDARLAERFAQLANSERDPLVLAAALSLIRCRIAADQLETLDHNDRTMFGLETDSSTFTVQLAGTDDCHQLLDLYRDEVNDPPAQTKPQVQQRIETMSGLLVPVLVSALSESSGEVASLLLGSRLYHRALCEQLLLQLEDDDLLAGWCSAAPLLSVVRVLELVELPEQSEQTLLERLLARIDSSSELWQPTRLLTLVRAVQSSSCPVSEQALDEFARWIVRAVDDILAKQVGHPEERFALLVELERFDSDAVKRVVAERILDVLGGLRAEAVSSYRLVRNVEIMQRRLLWKAPEDTQDFPIAQELAVQQLLQKEPAEKTGVGGLIEAMCLRQHLERADIDLLLPDYEVALTAAMRFASAAELTDALNSVRATSPFICNRILSRWPNFARLANGLLRRSGPMDAANLLRAISNAQSLIAARCLCGTGGEIDLQLVSRFARDIVATRDPLGTGLLLSVTHSIGSDFYSWKSSFATELAEEIGVDTVRKMAGDPRLSAGYYLVKGVWVAGASYRGEILDVVIEQVVRSIHRGRKHWGAEIALLLAADQEFGESAFERIRQQTPSEVIVQGMFRGSTAQSRVMFHRLGRVLHPEVPAMYRDQWEMHAFVDGLSTPAPAAALAVCAEVAKTLLDADVPDAGPAIFEASGGADVWANRLAHERNPGRFAQSLDNIIALSPVGAREVVDRLGAKPSRFRIRDHNLDALAAQVRFALLNDAPAGSRIVRSIHMVKPELSQGLFDELFEDDHLMYVVNGQLVSLQDPVDQAIAARNFALAGLTRGSPHGKWINAIYNARVQTIGLFASPQRVADIVRMLETWDTHWGAASANNIDLGRLGRRIRLGKSSDLAPSVRLLRTLCALGRIAPAAQILDDLLAADLADIARPASLTTLSQLADVVNRLKPDATPRMMRILRDKVDRSVERSVLIDERKFWQEVGHALWILRHTPGGRAFAHPIGEPQIHPNAAHSSVVAWVAAQVNQPGWGGDALGRVQDRLIRRQAILSPVDQAHLLLATVDGWSPELRTAAGLTSLAGLPFWMLRLLYQQATNDLEIDRLLTAAEPGIRERVNQGVARPDWDAFHVRLNLSGRDFRRAAHAE
ncbi:MULTISPECIES: hypothetical protein [unclassified Rhodococcus (in: high G+C Gram-positive bacteria)]|uniref:hypothetical protein n=1 Tax=unclassified Rhodococcus (in: high G+C Gram-positive bacteria) TaxID=192944 RepID=UPI0011EC5F28|nr:MULTISPECIES: hypothetical protein [unclassified Rhodococcus (in: high G+C Gram-positive bacteria)]KAA0926280.1 hypothetical protein FQ188_05600 [Rhodococcus sp. ANT_H53B]MDI9924414.1 hypothetical protein [Rhodococcus sp. IEGM 1341]